MARDLTKTFLSALKAEFPFLGQWVPSALNSAYRPVTFAVCRVLDPNTVWKLEYGRNNNSPDSAYTDGVTCVGLSDGTSLKWIDLEEGKTSPEDILEDDTKFVLVKYKFRNELVRDDPGHVAYTMYKRGEETVAAIKLATARSAAAMRAELE